MLNKFQYISAAFSVVCLLVLAVPAQAVVILDTGTPDETGNRSVFANPSLPGAQFLAQEFTLSQATTITTIEAYIGGSAGNQIVMNLADAIGGAATAANVLGTFNLATPSLGLSGAFVSAIVNQVLAAGNYFLVFSGGTNGGFMPISAPSTIGNRFLASDGSFPFTNVNTSLPIASNFSSSTFQPGIRISAVPEPGTLAILGLGLVSLGYARRRKATA